MVLWREFAGYWLCVGVLRYKFWEFGSRIRATFAKIHFSLWDCLLLVHPVCLRWLIQPNGQACIDQSHRSKVTAGVTVIGSTGVTSMTSCHTRRHTRYSWRCNTLCTSGFVDNVVILWTQWRRVATWTVSCRHNALLHATLIKWAKIWGHRPIRWINDKNCSLTTVLTAMDQKLQKS